MTTQPTLPTAIGATENTLRALLVKTLATTPIESYQEWVVLNAVSGAQAAGHADAWRRTAADALKVDIEPVERTLRERGLIGGAAGLTDAGEAALGAGRRAVGAATASLVDGVDETDLDTVRRVLGQMRTRTEGLLAETYQGT